MMLAAVVDYLRGWRRHFFHPKYLSACYWHRYYQTTLWRVS